MREKPDDRASDDLTMSAASPARHADYAFVRRAFASDDARPFAKRE